MAARKKREKPECIEAIVLASEVVVPKRRRPRQPRRQKQRRRRPEDCSEQAVLDPCATESLDSFIQSVPAPFINCNNPSDPYGIEATLREKRYKSRQEKTPIGARILDRAGDRLWKGRQYRKINKTYRKGVDDALDKFWGDMWGESGQASGADLMTAFDRLRDANNIEYERTKWYYITGLVAGCSALLCLGLFGDRIFGGGGSGGGQQQARVASVIVPPAPQEQYVAQAEAVLSPPPQPLNQYMPSHEHLRQYIDTCPSGEGNCYFFNCNGETFEEVSRHITSSRGYADSLLAYNQQHNTGPGSDWRYSDGKCYGKMIYPDMRKLTSIPISTGSTYEFDCIGLTFKDISKIVTGSSRSWQMVKGYNQSHNPGGNWSYQGDRCSGTIVLSPELVNHPERFQKNRRHSRNR
jgi:hypothetical protein